jgi:hypothetical protein
MHRMHALCQGIIVSVCVSVIPVLHETHHNEFRPVHVFFSANHSKAATSALHGGQSGEHR